jgi:hypothetical protein
MLQYKVYLHFELLEALPKRGIQRQKIVNFLQQLGKNPFVEGDFTDQDSSLRQRQIKIIGDHAITYWADHPAKTVLIVDISLANH